MIAWTGSQAEKGNVSNPFRCDAVQVVSWMNTTLGPRGRKSRMLCPGCFFDYGGYAGPQAVDAYGSLKGFSFGRERAVIARPQVVLRAHARQMRPAWRGLNRVRRRHRCACPSL